MPSLAPRELKKALSASGFEVFRTLAEEIVLAERVRENLILDSGVRVGALADGRIRVKLVVRAQRTDFPNDEDKTLFDRARELAAPAVASGFAETTTMATQMKDPADADRVLDTFYEVVLVKELASLEEAVPVVRFALSLDKAVGHREH